MISRIRKNWVIFLVLVVSFALNSFGVTWGLPHYLDWAIDSLSPFTMLEAVHSRFSNGWYSRYPPLQLAILALCSAPIMAYVMLSGGLNSPSPVFPFGLSNPLATLTSLIFISRIVSVFMGVTIVFLVYLTVKELFDRRSAVFSALIVALSYPFVYYSHNANADVPYLFWALLSIHRYTRVLKYGNVKDYVLFAFFGILSICTKDQAYGLFILSPLPILWFRYTELRSAHQRQPGWVELLLDRRLILAAVVAVSTFALVHNVVFNFSGFLTHVDVIIGSASSPYAQYAPTLTARLQLLAETIRQLATSLTLPLFTVCLVASVYYMFKFPRYSGPILFLAASYYLTFINVVRYVPLRFVLPVSIIVAFFGGKLFSELWDSGRWKILIRAAICLAFAYAALFPLQLNFLFVRDSRYAAEQWMQKHVQEGALIETFTAYSLLKYHPRFPIWANVRSSTAVAGTQWEPESRVDQGRLPNLYTGREPPDYIVLSQMYGEFLSDEVTADDGRQIFSDLFSGRTDYKLVATFQTETLVPLDLKDLSINPRIDIFARTRKTRDGY